MPASTEQTILLDLKAYNVDPETGFVATDNAALPEYHEPWTRLVTALPELLRLKQVGNKIDRLPILPLQFLTSETQWQRAYVTLGYLTQAYIWEVKEKPREIVPACLGEPFITVCHHLGMMPVLSYAGLCVWNCAPRTTGAGKPIVSNDHQYSLQEMNTDLTNFSKIRTFASFTGTRDEDAFNLVPVMVEAEGARLIPLLMTAVQAGLNGEQSDLQSSLESCTATLKRMIEYLQVIHDECNPDIFFHQIRPFLAGSAGNNNLPRGIDFLQNDKPSVIVKCVGGSAAQSALFQYVDRMLGIVHSSTIVLDMRAYMPQKHRKFLTTIDDCPSIQSIVRKYSNNTALQNALRECIGTLQEWRTKHIALVARYIVQPGRGSMKSPGSEEKGTAGSLPVPFLKRYRDETEFDREAVA